MSLSLIGIIFVQGYWIKNSVETNEEQFSFNAKQVLINVSEQLERQELDKYYVQYATLADSTMPTTARLSELFQIKQSELTNETFYFSNSLLQEDYKLSSNFLTEEKDSIDFKKLISSKVTRIVRNDQFDSTKKLSAEERFERISRLEENEKLLLLEAIKEKAAELPIYKRVDSSIIKDLIEAQLMARDINSDYEYAIYSGGLATKIKSEKFKKDSPGTYGIPIFESKKTNYELYINFIDKKKEVLSSIALMALLSIIFTLIIIIAYSSALSQLIKQRQISQIKTDFINNMTHEFKTPIATINLALDSVKNPKISGDPDKVKRYMGMIRDENRRMHAQVENVLRMSKLEKNELNIKKERLDLHELVEEAINHIELIVDDRHGYVQTHFGALQSSVLASESHFTSVIVNILDNAVKYSPGKPKIDIYTENVKNYIILKIRDQGKGMSKSVQKKVFEKFYREHTGDIHDVKGHGLGLAYVKQIVMDHHGQVMVESDKGKGSTFIIKLPLIS
ncbi:Signal-transduction histidine kinase senX3 [Mesonia oceanica]|uniref:Signal-transduction histidine kinase senX3 n=2 Tax=Mesonia oceanica TaxID=2687242 RepID=A0AC61YCC2_9FLAO|nr:Signal-transduction histidine kinase senX3 [Mesonia oceanica]|tara:strand:- start:202 stop:1728 length:1527 start_codon:yes stop_codon:yes gene_type:complete